MPALAAEGWDSRNMARLASRLARANAAVEVLADGAERYLARTDREPQTGSKGRTFDAKAFAALPEEVRLRLLLRAIDQHGHEGPAELGKVEALLTALDRNVIERQAGRRMSVTRPGLKQTVLKQTLFKQSLAGALVSLIDGRIRIEPAPPRRRRPG
jgi:tRNA(Ile)-lysidine synthase